MEWKGLPTPPMPASAIEIAWMDQKLWVDRNRLVIQLRPSALSEFARDTLGRAVAGLPGAALLRRISATGLAVIRFGEDVIDFAARQAQIMRLPLLANLVEYVEPDAIHLVQMAPAPNDPQIEGWPHDFIHSRAAWAIESGSLDVGIAILDTGIPLTASGTLVHPDLKSARCSVGVNTVSPGQLPGTGDSHGPAVAGIASAEGDNSQGVAGMAYGSRVRFFKAIQDGGAAFASDFNEGVVEAVTWAANEGVRLVINYSAGAIGDNATTKAAAEYASAHGAILCAAAGNQNSPILAPARYAATIPGLLAVGAVRLNAAGQLEPRPGARGNEMSVVAPGTQIRTTTAGGGWGNNFSGTSFATPFVSGLAALVWSKFPALTNQEVCQRIINNVTPRPAGADKKAWGAGTINAAKALT